MTRRDPLTGTRYYGRVWFRPQRMPRNGWRLSVGVPGAIFRIELSLWRRHR